MIISVERVHFAIDVRDKQIHPPVLVKIRRVHSHTRTWPAFGTVSHARDFPNLFELSVSTVYEQVVGYCIVGNKQVHPTVIVNIGCHHSPRLAEMIRDS